MGKVIAVANQKGGVGKTTTVAVLGDLLSKAGKKTLLIDMDGQANLTYNMGISRPDKLERTMKDILMDEANQEPINDGVKIVLNPKLSIWPANIELAGVEMSLISAIQREQILSRVVKKIRNDYDYIIIDTSPSLGILTINSLVAADEVVIPVQAQIFAIKGMEQLIKSISMAKIINDELVIAGFLLTMVDGRSIGQKDNICQLEEGFNFIHKFQTMIPLQTNASDASKEQQAITAFNAKGTAAKAYQDWLAEYLGITVYKNHSGQSIRVGETLTIKEGDYQIKFGHFNKQTRDGKIVASVGIYAEKDNRFGCVDQLSINRFMMKYRGMKKWQER